MARLVRAIHAFGYKEGRKTWMTRLKRVMTILGLAGGREIGVLRRLRLDALLGEIFAQLALLEHFADDVAAADEFALHI